MQDISAVVTYVPLFVDYMRQGNQTQSFYACGAKSEYRLESAVLEGVGHTAVSYTHLTLPTKRIV